MKNVTQCPPDGEVCAEIREDDRRPGHVIDVWYGDAVRLTLTYGEAVTLVDDLLALLERWANGLRAGTRTRR